MRPTSYLYASLTALGVGSGLYLYYLYLREKNINLERELEILQAKERERKIFLLKTTGACIVVGTCLYTALAAKRHIYQRLFSNEK
jgi:hypothetical protein